jgi:two-component system sensor histidine kinase KdpD
LREGKVYVPDQAKRAIEKFFRKGNLTALRELAMRRAAERVDSEMRDYMTTRSISGPWPASERLLVCISSNPIGERMLRTAKRLADDMNAEWYAVFVESPAQAHNTEVDQATVSRNMQLAETLGAQVVTLLGTSVADAVLEFSHKNNITKIVVGKPLRPAWYEFLRSTTADRIIRQSGNIDVYVISDYEEEVRPQIARSWLPHRPIRRYLQSLLLVAIVTIMGVPLQGRIEPTNLVMLYLMAVVLASIFLGRGPSLVASLVGVLAFDFFFVNPRFSFSVNDTQYLITFAGLLVVGLVISNSAALLRDQVDASRKRENQTAAVNALSRDLTVAADLNEMMKAIITRVKETFSREVVILLPEGEGLVARGFTPGFTLDENEMAVAAWTYQHGQTAGRGTDTLTAARIRYVPLKTSKGVVGVLGLTPTDKNDFMAPDKRQLLESFVNLSAMAIERAMLSEQASQAQMLRSTERLQTALLNSISHDLRTPLASITGALSTLKEDNQKSAESGTVIPRYHKELLENALSEADRLNRLVSNLLDMTRLESGALKMTREPVDVQDLIGTALAQTNKRLEGHPLTIHIPPDLPLVEGDFLLLLQVLENLLDNAVKYSPPQGPVEVYADRVHKEIHLTIADHGLGIPEGDLKRIFDKFYRVQRPDGVTGTGLGLSICKGIVEAHGGRIWAQNRAEGGSTLTFTLPAK